MKTLTEIERDWIPLCNDNLVEIPTENPVIRLEHKRTKQHAYYDIKSGKFLSQQEAFDVLRGDDSYYLRSS